jgi:hypothetical protein
MAGSSQQQQQLFSSLPATPSRTSTVGLPSNLRLSTPAHLAGIKAFMMFPGALQLPGSPARTPKAATAAVYQLASASGFATQPGAGILGNSTVCGTDAWHGQPESPACSVYQTPSAPDDEACFLGGTGQPATRKAAQAACTQTSPPCNSSSQPAAQQPHQPSPWTEWWRGLESGAAAQGHNHSPAVRPHVLFSQEESSAAGSPEPVAKSVAEDATAPSPASFPFGCRPAATAASSANKQQQQQHATASPGGCKQGVRSLSPISLADDGVDTEHDDDGGCIAPSPAWSVHTNWAAVGHEEDAAAGGLRSMAEAVEAAAAAGASVSPDSCSGSYLKTPCVGSGLGAACAATRAGSATEQLPLQAVTNTAQAQPAAAYTPGISSIDGLGDMSPAEALAALSQLAHKIKARMDQAATAGLLGGVAPVISRGDLGMIVPSPIAGRGGSAVGRWQQGAMNDEQ